jgi:transcriptional regulator with XRE-family HTH domain
MAHARERLVRWFEASGKTREAVGSELECSGAYVGLLLSGKRKRPGLDIAFAIQRATAGWEDGAILATEWIDAESGEAAAAEGEAA